MTDDVFDRLVDRAWPALGRTDSGGWTLRTAGGVTKRANSVLPLGGRRDLDPAVDAAEEFYAGQGLPCAFSVGPGAAPGLDGLLEARGYRVVDPTLVMVAPLEPVAPGAGRGWAPVPGAGPALGGVPAPEEGAEPSRGVGAPEDGGSGAEVRLAAEPGADWLDVWWSVDGRGGDDARETARRILTGVPAVYGSLGAEAVGRGVVQGEWLGVYCMATAAHARRRGHARRILNALLSHGREQGARHAYLCVVEANTAARSLYERLGFTVSARYHYRVR
ncbi:putative N-acetyltransferase YobR [Planomonospora parontospora subsp. parontospora]|uniref:N-acetyltransferase YobR n=2 Tax=Planomonospora parontospora TaxID=58119 RepID=A0AA37BFM9_9ACTN|nr:GNAT family N-acetyltransferase [Planomonospora parontospora]GGK64039.1 putative N-acetyltransferase YobR [Planomonospora parontospora]GII08133.1 putative N-acetyltransferase YobR [Planomonospora parontospora subsp. parontospora]